MIRKVLQDLVEATETLSYEPDSCGPDLYVCEGCAATQNVLDETPFQHRADCPIVAAKALLERWGDEHEAIARKIVNTLIVESLKNQMNDIAHDVQLVTEILNESL